MGGGSSEPSRQCEIHRNRKNDERYGQGKDRSDRSGDDPECPYSLAPLAGLEADMLNWPVAWLVFHKIGAVVGSDELPREGLDIGDRVSEWPLELRAWLACDEGTTPSLAQEFSRVGVASQGPRRCGPTPISNTTPDPTLDPVRRAEVVSVSGIVFVPNLTLRPRIDDGDVRPISQPDRKLVEPIDWLVSLLELPVEAKQTAPITARSFTPEPEGALPIRPLRAGRADHSHAASRLLTK
jgi:hypothetical protein